jgi:hypothetical protein
MNFQTDNNFPGHVCCLRYVGADSSAQINRKIVRINPHLPIQAIPICALTGITG